MRCFIGFFGLTRSLKQTVDSIRSGFYAPLFAAGIPMLRAGHFNLPDCIDNPRSGEAALVPDRRETALLDLDLCWVEPQSDAMIAEAWQFARAYPDAFGDGYRSLANLCHQLHSLRRLWSLLRMLGAERRDIVLLLRPDLLYLDVLDIEAHVQPLLSGQADIIVPGWQGWGGLNDRFAFCTGHAASLYATRLRRFRDGCRAIGTMHAETFLKWLLQEQELRVMTTGLRAVRLRANGAIAANDRPMAQGFVAAG
ncbi:hypothetical protein [Rhodopila globiformis]|uniref:Uncharacterized protein n=1 Tax=Rhodopila globiformis TaxID=1071 RepID=A0A2S6N400_RHOGL|nr:hypothetical protein [Rhodopila globiformis]PPQ29343.1 hypothetical protein CCS01_21960 [Rhodopila globiformis]